MSLAQASVVGPNEAEILARFGLDQAKLLGAGGESRVFALNDNRVLRIFHATHEPLDSGVADLLASWDGLDLGFGVPAVLDVGREGAQSWSIDRRVPGRSLESFLQQTRDHDARRRALLGALDIAGQLKYLPLPTTSGSPWRRVFEPDKQFPSLVDLLVDQIDAGSGQNWDALSDRVPALAHRRQQLLDALAAREVQPGFVHGDLAPGNVLCDEAGHITGICDISPHALVADPVLDEVGVACLLLGYPEADADSQWLSSVLEQRLGPDAWLVSAYRQFYGFYYAMDAAILDWCAAQFR